MAVYGRRTVAGERLDGRGHDVIAAAAAVGSAGAEAGASGRSCWRADVWRAGRGHPVPAGGPCSAAAPFVAPEARHRHVPAAGRQLGRPAGRPVRPDGAVLDLSPGAVVVLDGGQWTVQLREPHLGRIVLAGPDGARQQVSMQFLASHPGCFTSSRTSAPGAGRGRQEAGPGDLAPGRRELAELRQAHLLEVATGFRSGSSLHPRPGEPKPEYDPGATTLTQRRHAKAAELAALDPEQARLLGLDHVGYRTLIRWENGRRRAGLVGCADDRWLRESGGHPSVTEQIREAMLMVREQTRHRSRVTMKTRHVLVCQYVRETFGAEAGFPSYRTFCRVWREWFGPGGARPRNDGSDGLPAKAGHVVVSRPGQVVALDTTVLPVKVREGMFGDPVSVHLTLALDVYTHSLVAFRLTLVSDTSVDVAMLLRDVMMPLPMREGWGPEMAWPYPGIPAAVVAEFAGYQAGRAAVLHPGDRHYRSRVGLQKPPAPGSAESPGLQHPSRPHAAPPGQGRLRAGIRRDQAAAVREAARLCRRRRRRPRRRPGGRRTADDRGDGTHGRFLDRRHLARPGAARLPARLGSRRDAQPEHAVRRLVRPGRVRPGSPAAGTVLRTAASALCQHRRAPRSEDPRPLV